MVNTHLHVDHVGWNTRLDGSSWVPTFPNATYLMPRAHFEFFNPADNPQIAGSIAPGTRRRLLGWLKDWAPLTRY